MTEFVASILSPDLDGVLRQAQAAALGGATWVELRLDGFAADQLVELDPAAVLSNCRLPVLVTCRLPRDGGAYQGTLADRRTLLQRWLDAGANGIDLEEWEEWTPPRASSLPLYIRSHHNWQGVTPGLPALRDRLLRLGANRAKICVFAHDLADADPVMQLLARTDQKQQPTVAFAMGESAWPSRILACLLGAPAIYTTTHGGVATGPGQVDLGHVAGGIYDLRRIGPSTALFGLLGNPAYQSLGPYLHNRAFRRIGFDGIYLPLETSRPEVVLQMLPRRQLRGLSVTAPFKERLAKLCHVQHEEANELGAVNTLVLPAHGNVEGYNTDVVGITQALQDVLVTRPRGQAAVLGGGGAARAAALALQRCGYEVTILARSLERMREFARRRGFRLARLDAAVLQELAPAAVVHATPVGTGDDGVRILPEWRIQPGTIVMDCVYRPRQTALLRAAAAAGAVTVSGMEMFLHQAAEQLRLFTGERFVAAELQAVVPG